MVFKTQGLPQDLKVMQAHQNFEIHNMILEIKWRNEGDDNGEFLMEWIFNSYQINPERNRFEDWIEYYASESALNIKAWCTLLYDDEWFAEINSASYNLSYYVDQEVEDIRDRYILAATYWLTPLLVAQKWGMMRLFLNRCGMKTWVTVWYLFCVTVGVWIVKQSTTNPNPRLAYHPSAALIYLILVICDIAEFLISHYKGHRNLIKKQHLPLINSLLLFWKFNHFFSWAWTMGPIISFTCHCVRDMLFALNQNNLGSETLFYYTPIQTTTTSTGDGATSSGKKGGGGKQAGAEGGDENTTDGGAGMSRVLGQAVGLL